jgi:hypothetical protein
MSPQAGAKQLYPWTATRQLQTAPSACWGETSPFFSAGALSRHYYFGVLYFTFYIDAERQAELEPIIMMAMVMRDKILISHY